MPDRFQTLYELSAFLYTQGSPILISASNLKLDTVSGNVFVQNKFKCLSNKKIIALIISISAFDISGAEVPGVNNYQYVDLNIYNGQHFGADKAVLLPDKNTRAYSIKSIKVVFEDSSTWSLNDTTLLKSLQPPIPLLSILDDASLYEYQQELNPLATYIPVSYDDLWLCTCGNFNHKNNASCTSCHASMEHVFSAFVPSHLKEKADERLEAERHASEQQALRQQASRQKIKIISLVAGPLAAVVLLFTLWIVPYVISPHMAYSSAEDLITASDYEAAAEQFSALGDYKDSAVRKQDALYEYAMQLRSNEEYDKAIEVFESLNGYRDADNQAEEIRDKQAIMLMEVQYEQANTLYEEENYGAAAISFYNLGEYSDARNRSLSIWKKLHPNASVSTGSSTIALKNDQTIVMTGWDIESYQKGLSNTFRNVVSVIGDSGSYGFFGIRNDGTVVAMTPLSIDRVSEWYDIIKLAWSGTTLFALRADGTVLVGETTLSTDNQSIDTVISWSNITDIVAENLFTAALTEEGTVQIVPTNPQLGVSLPSKQSKWDNIIKICSNSTGIFGLKNDGTVLVSSIDNSVDYDVAKWTDIVEISAGMFHLVGLKSDGTVVATGSNYAGQCDVGDWTDIAAIYTGLGNTIGLKSDGTLVAIGDNGHGQCDVDNWTDIVVPTTPNT